MNVAFRIAKRYFFSKNKKTFISLIANISMLGVGVGVGVWGGVGVGVGVGLGVGVGATREVTAMSSTVMFIELVLPPR